MIDVSWKRMLLLLMLLVVVEMMVELLLLQLLWMRLHRGRRLLNQHRRFADRFLLLLVGFDFDRWRVSIGRNDRRSTGGSHFRCSRRDRRYHRMMRRRRKMRWWRIDGLHPRTRTGIDEFVGLLPCGT